VARFLFSTTTSAISEFIIKKFFHFFITIKINFMGNLLYIIAVILIIGWLLGFFAFHAGNIIHALLVIAVIAIIIRLIQGRQV